MIFLNYPSKVERKLVITFLTYSLIKSRKSLELLPVLIRIKVDDFIKEYKLSLRKRNKKTSLQSTLQRADIRCSGKEYPLQPRQVIIYKFFEEKYYFCGPYYTENL